MKPRRIWAVRMGDWKLVSAHAWRDVPSSVGAPRLINLAADPAERHDVSAQFPEKRAALAAAYAAWERLLPEPLWAPDDDPAGGESRQKRTQRRNELQQKRKK
jgi:arylsulfatase A-like enzyme